ncbi:MAG: hypothetical protein U1E33_08735 [Rhodospirillales bacterium]
MLDALIDGVEAVAVVVEPAGEAFGLADPDDEVYLAAAVAGGAAVLITGNLRDFAAASSVATTILTPRAFLDRSA